MRKLVPDEVLKRAAKCPWNHSCLETGTCGDRPVCDIESADGEEVLFLATDHVVECPFRLTYGYSQVCICPVRYWLFCQEGW